jgi:hypothetical protein
MVRSSPVQKITTTVDGVTHEGKYYTHDRSVIVHYQGSRKETWFSEDGVSAAGLAVLLLGELVREQIKQSPSSGSPAAD